MLSDIQFKAHRISSRVLPGVLTSVVDEHDIYWPCDSPMGGRAEREDDERGPRNGTDGEDVP